MSQDAKNEVISFTDMLKHLPGVVKKLPYIATGLSQTYLRKKDTPTGFAVAFEKAVHQHPQGIALRYEEQKFTYAELNAWANQISHYFLSINAKKGDVVAVMIENRPELLATVLGLAKIGVISALVNTAQTHKVLTHSINLVKPIALILGEECQQAILDIREHLDITPERQYWFADQETLKNTGQAPKNFQNLAKILPQYAQFNPPTTQQNVGKDGVFYIYTSGTTGLPKAAIFSNGRWTLAYGTYGHIIDLHHDDVLYSTLPFYHATGMVVCWCGVIAGQATLALRRKFSRSNFWKDVKKFDATAIGYVGELCRYLMDNPPSEDEHNHRVTKMIGNGLRPNIWQDFKKRFGIKEVLELYASSEGNIGFNNVFNFDNTVGFSPLPYAIVAFDKETNQPIRDKNGFCQKVKAGETGLLIGKITARTPFDGYTDPEKNKAVLMQNVFKEGDHYFITGDLVRSLGFRHAQFVDRLGDTFRWKGENVSTTEVENIIGTHPKIAEVAVYGVEIPQTNGRAGMAAICLKDNCSLNAQDLADMVDLFKQQLPAYAIPVFIRIQQQMETTTTFKYPKARLKEQAFDPENCKDPVYVLLPQQQQYILMRDDIYQGIIQADYHF
ncbi:long-chain-acyl-CoA synthetase [Acinetobacter qingfengensis]|uniref:Long-chain-acyl-CoA synthetase n=1 Tax=Acinetobacter qingfengensis TaxID=1262585 RepID=A0A1E7R304_9GAMM|nr:long-chain-acyl-CoA synthetase [Acinetobacter qingfengensis]KAA8733769.1 long-chain-acyl-CoA synthetase [Acinetobacter qingfengensis]OEY93720.1 long-chain-acyl-CoA synthetase [Acinetobacter qingfengensis]